MEILRFWQQFSGQSPAGGLKRQNPSDSIQQFRLFRDLLDCFPFEPLPLTLSLSLID